MVTSVTLAEGSWAPSSSCRSHTALTQTDSNGANPNAGRISRYASCIVKTYVTHILLSPTADAPRFPFPHSRPRRPQSSGLRAPLPAPPPALSAPLSPYAPPLSARARPIPRPPAADFTSQSRIWSVAAGRKGEEPERARLRWRRRRQHQAPPRRPSTTTVSTRSSVQPPASPLASDPPSRAHPSGTKPSVRRSGGRPSAQLHHTRPPLSATTTAKAQVKNNILTLD